MLLLSTRSDVATDWQPKILRDSNKAVAPRAEATRLIVGQLSQHQGPGLTLERHSCHGYASARPTPPLSGFLAGVLINRKSTADGLQNKN
jgi:hypothetical protein